VPPWLRGEAFDLVVADIEDHSITLVFRDKTAPRFDIEPDFTVFAGYANWKTGDLKPIEAFMAGRIRILGDMGLVLQMQAAQMQAAAGAGKG